MGKISIIGTILVAVSIAFYSTTIVPEGFSQPWHLRAVLTSVRGSIIASRLLTMVGIEEVHALRFVAGSGVFIPGAYMQNDSDVIQADDIIDDVPVRYFAPAVKTGGKMPGMVFFHGGGWAIGSIATYSPITYELAKRLGVFVMSVEYRLAPENPFPAGFEDCVKVTKHFLKNAPNKFGVDPKRIAVIGDSAGGNLAAAVSLHLRNNKVVPKLKMQILIYPSLQGTDFNTPSMQFNEHGPFLTKFSTLHYKNIYLFGHVQHSDLFATSSHTSPEYKKTMGRKYLDYNELPDDELKKAHRPVSTDKGNRSFWEEHRSKLTNPYFSPLHEPNLKGLPHTFVTTCQYDVLRDDGYFYSGRLRKQGVKVVHLNWRACFHGFINFIHIFETADEKFNDMIAYIAKNL